MFDFEFEVWIIKFALIINDPRYKFAVNCVKINGARGMIKISQIQQGSGIAEDNFQKLEIAMYIKLVKL